LQFLIIIFNALFLQLVSRLRPNLILQLRQFLIVFHENVVVYIINSLILL
jgi:hypothetical protein